MNIWFDFTNPPHVNFYLPFIRHFERNENNKIIISAREFVETVKLAELNGLKPIVLGKHGGKNRVSKALNLVSREFQLLNTIGNFGISLSSNYEAPLACWLKRKFSIVFDDNDISPNWLYSAFADKVISPSEIDKEAMLKMGIGKKQLITYNGYKEDVYIADYIPDTQFLEKIPFKQFVTVRPENLQASYVPVGARSIVPELINKLVNAGINVLYLPRYKSDIGYLKNNEQVFVPDSPLNGLDVCYYSDAVLTGAGTFSREAAIMGTPSVSFFSGNVFLGVDKSMFINKMVYFSRDPDSIVQFVKSSKKNLFNKQRCTGVQQEVFSLVDGIIKNI